MKCVKLGTLVAMLVLAFTSSTVAAPAPFYKWQSKLNGYIACGQTSLGSGWILFSKTRYKDAGCRTQY